MAGRPAVFISYKRDHEASEVLAIQLEAALTDRFEIWRDVGIQPGERWSDELWRWLMECSAAIALVSDEATTSDWCRREWSVLAARASHSHLRVIPVRLDATASDILDHLQSVTSPDPVPQVVTRLAGLPTQTPSPSDFLAAHQAWLRWLYEDAPALGGQPFALGDVYVDTECGALTWEQLSADRSIDPFDEKDGGRTDLVDTVLGHFGDPEFRDLVVVQGPAGSGKSAFTLRLAQRLMDEGMRPVLVRFRDLRLSTYDDLDAQLQDAVRVGPVGEHPPPPRGSLFTDEILGETARLGDATVSRTVVILDGWDEVDIAGNLPFRDQIERWLPRVRQRFTQRAGPPVRLLLTGRPSTVVDRSDLLWKPTPVLTVRTLRPYQLRGYAARISARLTAADGADWSLDLDRCEEAFASYTRWFEDRGEQGTDVLGSPLLALLAFRTLADAERQDGDLFAEPSALYQALIDVTTKHAGKADDSPGGTVHRGGPELRRLLQRVATVITHRGRESVSAEELRLRLEDDGALEDWARRAAEESTLHELVVNFYFKSHPELGCEFLHKSFREYLHAESIVAALEAAVEGHTGPLPLPGVDNKQDYPEGTRHHRTSRALGRLLSPQWLTTEVRGHVFWLMEQQCKSEPERWVAVRDLLADVYTWWSRRTHLRMHVERRRGQLKWLPPPIVELLEEAAPLDDPGLRWSNSTPRLDAILGRALIQLTAKAHALLLDHPGVPGRDHQSLLSGKLRFRPFAPHTDGIAARLTVPDPPHGLGLNGAYLGPADLSELNIGAVLLVGIDAADSLLTNTVFNRTILTGADLSGADLTRVVAHDVELVEANLRSSRLTQARFRLGRFDQSDLSDANLSFSDFEGTSFRYARMAKANLAGVHLRDVLLAPAQLPDADLTGALIETTNLVNVDLRGAELTRARLWGTDLTLADLRGANLTGAQFGDCMLSQTSFGDNDVTGATVGGVDMAAVLGLAAEG